MMGKENYGIPGLVAVLVAACGLPADEVGQRQQAGEHQQGEHQQGTDLFGGISVAGFRYDSLSKDGAPLGNVRIVRGQLKAERPDGTSLSPWEFAGVKLQGELSDGSLRAFKISEVKPHPTVADSYLYRLKEIGGASRDLCRPTADPNDTVGVHAVPLAATWDGLGARSESVTTFTLACTSGVLQKCYAWGYTPWADGVHDGAEMVMLHQICSRVARADYCYDGHPHTLDGTDVYTWNDLYPDVDWVPWWVRPAGGGDPVVWDRYGRLMRFEGAWGHKGMLCLSHLRWLHLPPTTCNYARLPDKTKICDTEAEARALAAPGERLIFNESFISSLPF